jgi:hypothetical protein
MKYLIAIVMLTASMTASANPYALGNLFSKCELVKTFIESGGTTNIQEASVCLSMFSGVLFALHGTGQICLNEGHKKQTMGAMLEGFVDATRDVMKTDSEIKDLNTAYVMSGYLLSNYECAVTLDSLPKGERF